jgi:hypothetical protein
MLSMPVVYRITVFSLYRTQMWAQSPLLYRIQECCMLCSQHFSDFDITTAEEIHLNGMTV